MGADARADARAAWCAVAVGWHDSYPIGWNATFDLVREQDELDVRVVVDRSVVEIFVAGGRVAGLMATRTPNSTLATAVHLFAPAEALVASLDIWSMGCGWNETGRSLGH